MSKDFWCDLDRLVRLDPGARGVARLERANPLKTACEALLGAESVLLVTGFWYLAGSAPETDGPLGALALGDALGALGCQVGYLTDAPCREVLEELEALPLLVPDLEGLSPEALRERLADVTALLGTTHLVAVERAGRDRHGHYRNLKGQDIGSHTAPLDELFLLASELELETLAIGDGGNEIGMGSLSDAERALLFGTGEGSSVVPADHLVVSGVSDWGAYGLVTGLSRLTGHDLLPEKIHQEERMRVMLEVGAVDGVTGADEPSVDGLPLEEGLSLVESMRKLLD